MTSVREDVEKIERLYADIHRFLCSAFLLRFQIIFVDWFPFSRNISFNQQLLEANIHFYICLKLFLSPIILLCEVRLRSRHSATQNGPSPDPKCAGDLISDCQPRESEKYIFVAYNPLCLGSFVITAQTD